MGAKPPVHYQRHTAGVCVGQNNVCRTKTHLAICSTQINNIPYTGKRQLSVKVYRPIPRNGDPPAAKVRTIFARGMGQLGRLRAIERPTSIFSLVSPFNLCREQKRTLEIECEAAKQCNNEATQQ